MNADWMVRLGRRAEQDYREILGWTERSFGAAQAQSYAQTISLAVQALAAGPDTPGSKLREEIGPGIRTLHIARNGRKGRHFVVYRVGGDRTIDVIRLLHESMDLQRHVPSSNDG